MEQKWVRHHTRPFLARPVMSVPENGRARSGRLCQTKIPPNQRPPLSPVPKGGLSKEVLLHTHYIPTIYPLYTHYIPTIYPLYTHYIPTIYPLYTHYTPTIYPLYTLCRAKFVSQTVCKLLPQLLPQLVCALNFFRIKDGFKKLLNYFAL